MNHAPPEAPQETRYAALIEARELGAVVAGSGKRALAFAIDIGLGVMLGAPAIVCLVLLAQGRPATWLWPMLLLVIGVALLWIFQFVTITTHGLRGVTAGKAMLGLRSSSVREHRKPGFWRIVLRSLVLSLSCIVPVLGPAVVFLSSLWDPLRAGRSWLDRLAGCWVIDVRAGFDPHDRAALLAARRARDLGSVSTAEALVPLGSDAPAETLRSLLAVRSHAGVVGFAGALAGWQSEPRQAVALPRQPQQSQQAQQSQQPQHPPTPAAAPQPTPRHAGSPESPTPTPTPAPAPAPASAPMPTPTPARPRLLFDDGSMVEVPVLGVIGRSPDAIGEFAHAMRLRLHDEQRRISKAHLEIGVDERGCWVRDLGSVNGTEAEAPGSAAVRLAAGQRNYLAAGTIVRLGSREFVLLDGTFEGATA